MTVKEAVAMLNDTPFELKGSFSGKIYHKSYLNTRKNFEKYANFEVIDRPFYADVRLMGNEYNHRAVGVIVIWMCDYDICKSKER